MIAPWQLLLAVGLGVLLAGATYAIPVRARFRDAVERFATWRDDSLAAVFGDDD